MIPILYEKDENIFATNGLGRLRDCISCVVTEERNGIYECDFEYPITGANYDLITLGRIIGVTHDDTGTIQPFDIVSASKPIDGVVTFHAVHISYRLSFQTVTGTSINSLAAAFTLFGNITGTPFSYWTDKTSTGYLASADGIPKSVRSMLGGIEGSVLDAYGGEYEWDRFTVKLWASRGQYRDFSIRYGVNMLDYTEETDASGTWSSCIPYWTDGTEVVVGSKQNSGGTTITGRDQCIPLDISDKFEEKPTTAQVEAAARSYMSSNVPYLPTQTINVSFVRLQDMNEYAGFSNLLTCNLCDTIKVIFPDYKTSANFKIVKTVWDVLSDRYDSMELGTLSTTLAEALGISNTPERTTPNTAGQVVYNWLPSNKSCPNNTATELVTMTLDKGTWVIVAGVRWAGNTNGYRQLNVYNVSGAAEIHQLISPASGHYTQMNFTRIWEIPADNTPIYLNGRQTSGGALNALAGGGNWGTYLTAVRIK